MAADGNETAPEISISFPFKIPGFPERNGTIDLDVVAGDEILASKNLETLAKVSGLVASMREEKRLRQRGGRFTLYWEHDTSRGVDKESLVKTLHFCSGETITVGVKNGECCAIIAALFRLDVSDARESIAELCDFAVEQARRNVVWGAVLLKASSRYPECCNEQCTLDERLAKVVLTKERIHDEYSVVVDGCLMTLDSRYLDMAEYGKPRTQWGEFSIRTRYVRYHAEMDQKERDSLVTFNLGVFINEELEAMDEQGILNREIIASMYSAILSEGSVDKGDVNMMSPFLPSCQDDENRSKTLYNSEMFPPFSLLETEMLSVTPDLPQSSMVSCSGISLTTLSLEGE